MIPIALTSNDAANYVNALFLVYIVVLGCVSET